MTWMGVATTRHKQTGPHGGRFRSGRYLIPRHVFLDVEGRGGDPDLHIHFEWRDDRPQAVDVQIISKPGGRGVRSSDIESMSLDGMARSAFAEYTDLITEEGPGFVTSASVDWSHPSRERDRWELDGKLAGAIADRRAQVGRHDLDRVARLYAEYRGRNALAAIAADLGVSERTAARRVKAAREAGLIPDGEQGDDGQR